MPGTDYYIIMDFTQLTENHLKFEYKEEDTIT